VFRDATIEIESLEDIDQTIDELFKIYQTEGRTELFEEMCPYFGMLWPAGRVLAHYISERLLPHASRILEIGCGLALPSLYLAKRGLWVEATDVHPDVPLFLEHNRNLNQLGAAESGPHCISLDWRTPLERDRKWDLILASDVLYDKTQPEALLEFFSGALAANGRILIADPGRSYFQGFLDDASKRGFHVKTEGLFGVLIGELSRNVVS
jgi:predicted nicotinamide N-methyase